MKIKLDELQLKIMTELWKMGEGSVASIREALKADKELAITTIGTVLSRLEKKGVVTHSKQGRQFIYHPLITEHQVRNSLLSNLTNQFFRGDTANLVNHLISESELGAEDLDELEQMIRDHKKKMK